MSVELKNVIRIEDPESYTYYMGTLRPRDIKQLTFVPVVSKSSSAGTTLALNERDDGGYQQAGDPKRMVAIKNFLKDKSRSVIPLLAFSTWKMGVFAI
jgi:hypothetical protein